LQSNRGGGRKLRLLPVWIILLRCRRGRGRAREFSPAGAIAINSATLPRVFVTSNGFAESFLSLSLSLSLSHSLFLSLSLSRVSFLDRGTRSVAFQKRLRALINCALEPPPSPVFLNKVETRAKQGSTRRRWIKCISLPAADTGEQANDHSVYRLPRTLFVKALPPNGAIAFPRVGRGCRNARRKSLSALRSGRGMQRILLCTPTLM